ncbi:MAG: hypothetical protein ACKVT0_09360 [Planctomycetaceae bacterium]
MTVRSYKAVFSVAALAILTVCGVWHFAPHAKGNVRPIEVRVIGDHSLPVPGKIAVYDSLAELETNSLADQFVLSRPIDFSREKLLRVDWRAVGCYTDEMKQSNAPATPLFGKLAHNTRRGGNDVSFYIESPIQGSLFGTVVHAVFQQQIGSDWFTVPLNARVAYSEFGSTTAVDLLMALFMTLTVTLVIVSVLTGRQRRESAGALQVD